MVKLFSQEVERIFEGKTLSRIAKIRSRSLSNFPLAKQYSIVLLGRVLSQGERKFVNPLSWERGRGEGNSSFAEQTEKNLASYRPNVLTTSDKLDCFATARNDEICHPELVSGSHVFTSARNTDEGKMFAKQTETNLASYHPNVLTTSNKLDCFARPADDGNRARNDVKTLVPQYLSALVPSKKVAFTLAEVLITLGIIGVVAAITMPTLIANYQKKVFSALLKQDVSWVQNSIKRILADEGIENVYESSVGTLAFDAGNRQTVPAVDGTKFGEYFKLDKYEFSIPSDDELDNMSDEELYDLENKMLNSFSVYSLYYGQAYRLKNGGCFVVYTQAYGYPGSFPSGSTYFIVDVNCDKKPNIVGKDRFAIGLEKNGALVRKSLTKEDLEYYSNLCTENQKEIAEGNPYLNVYGSALWPCSVPVIVDGFNIK